MPDVLVVGAGPSGLTMANVLSHKGIAPLVIDAKSGPTDQSRATIVHVRSLELLDKLNLATAMVEAGARVDAVRMRAAGRDLARFPLDRSIATPFPFALALPQSATERILLRGIEPHRVHWGTRLVGYEQDQDEVVAVLRGPDGQLHEIAVRHLVGADGAHSVVRRLAGVSFPGSSYAPVAFLADVRLDPPPTGHVLDLNLAQGGFVGILGLGTGWFRLFGALTPAYARRFAVLDEGQSVPLADLQQWFDEYFQIPVRIREAAWNSIYRIHHRLAESFRVARIFLVGDAAHIHAPAGGQGMNLGIGDAVNLGWKLALVHTGHARSELLDTYQAERRPVAQSVLRGADRGFELEATSNPLVEWFRRHLLPPVIIGAGHVPNVRRAIFNLFSQTWISYRGSPAVTTAGSRWGPQPGDRAPYAPLAAGHSPSDCLRGLDHHLLVFSAHPDHAIAAGQAIKASRLPVRIHIITDDQRELRRRYRIAKPRVVLVRPDGHIAVTIPADDLRALREHLNRWYTSDH